MNIPRYKACKYLQVYEITAVKDNCVYKTKPIGFIKESDKQNYPSEKYILSSISISLDKETIELVPYLSE